MNNLEELYQSIILDHNRNPHNFGQLDDASCSLFISNPLCGDKINIDLQIKDNIITDIRFSGSGCAICIASTSLMTDEVKRKSLNEVYKLISIFQNTLKSNKSEEGFPDKLKVFTNIHQFPMRVKCATLAWHILNDLISPYIREIRK